jgi:hypothetical protein
MENLTIIGVVTHILEKKQGGSIEKPYTSQDIVIKTSGQYPKSVCLNLYNKEMTAQIGDEIEVSFNIESREYNNKWYSNLKVWNLKIR